MPSEKMQEKAKIYLTCLKGDEVGAGNQRYSFSLKDGWGIENNPLAAAPCGKQGTYSAIAEQGRQRQMQKIFSVLK